MKNKRIPWNKGLKTGFKSWLGKKRPELINTNAVKTMFKKGLIPWNKGIKGFMAGEQNGNWKNARYQDGRYMRINRDGQHYWEHRYLMEQFLERKLDKDEIVHHKDNNTLNNNMENLIILTRYEHAKLHLTPDICRMGGLACKGIPKRRRGVVSNDRID